MRSANFGPRRNGLRPHMVVVHYTVMGFEASLERLCDPAAEVSAHYVIDRDGTLVPLVDEANRAWHAGQGAWRGLDDINSRSIGIELVNSGQEPFAASQMNRLEALLADVMTRHTIQPHDVIGHSDMAPGRKADPGIRFDWARLARQGLALPAPACQGSAGPASMARFLTALERIGYPSGSDHDLLSAFRARFRPAGCGDLDKMDCDLAEAIAAHIDD